MTPLPAAIGGTAQLMAWRVDRAAHASTWDSGIGAELEGGRWNPRGHRVVYCAFDPSTAILEVAVHKGLHVLDTQAHALTSLVLGPTAATGTHVVRPEDVPNPAWLFGCDPSAGQQAFGLDLIRRHTFVVFPSVVSQRSWNIVFDPAKAAGQYLRFTQERLVVDTRLVPPGKPMAP
jgi:RES domain-containing protein